MTTCANIMCNRDAECTVSIIGYNPVVKALCIDHAYQFARVTYANGIAVTIATTP